MMSAGSPASRRSFMAPTAPNTPSILQPVLASNEGSSASTNPWAAPPLRILTVFACVIARSLHLDAGLLDHLGPLVDVASQEGIERGRRHGQGDGALLGPGLAHRRFGDDLGDLDRAAGRADGERARSWPRSRARPPRSPSARPAARS